MEYLVAAREVGDSLFIISDLRRLLYRTLRALEFHNRPNLGFRSAPPQALRYRRAPRAKPNQTAAFFEFSQILLVGNGNLRLAILEVDRARKGSIWERLP